MASEPKDHNKPDISLVVPCYNEEANIGNTLEAAVAALRELERPFEVLAINDGSRDATLVAIRALSDELPELEVVDLLRNYGQTAAYRVGIEQAQGAYVVFFSGDLEIPAGEIVKVIRELDAGNDFVNTARTDRWGGSHALKSKLANRLLNRISGICVTDRGSGLKGMRREIARSLTLYGEWHRFLPDLASIHTSRIKEIEVPFEERKSGTSSYRGRLKSLSVFLDLATVAFTVHSQRKPFSLLPGRLFGFTGLVVGTAGFVVSAWLAGQKLLFGATLADRPLFLVSVLATILGINMVMVGVLGELVMQMREDIRGRPLGTRIHRRLNTEGSTADAETGQKDG